MPGFAAGVDDCGESVGVLYYLALEVQGVAVEQR